MSESAGALIECAVALTREFYARPARDVAPDLIGKLFVRRVGRQLLTGWIVETEAYMGTDDPASHSYRGPTRRNRSMFGPPGHLYVYRSYGIHSCANVVTSPEGTATAVLLRAVEPVDGVELMRHLRGVEDVRLLSSGPGRLCQAFGLSLSDDGLDLLGEQCYIAAGRTAEIVTTPRMGITKAVEQLWRFVDAHSVFASRPTPGSGSERLRKRP
jgi:DNA-3-methyladenine glycosylase